MKDENHGKYSEHVTVTSVESDERMLSITIGSFFKTYQNLTGRVW